MGNRIGLNILNHVIIPSVDVRLFRFNQMGNMIAVIATGNMFYNNLDIQLKDNNTCQDWCGLVQIYHIKVQHYNKQIEILAQNTEYLGIIK